MAGLSNCIVPVILDVESGPSRSTIKNSIQATSEAKAMRTENHIKCDLGQVSGASGSALLSEGESSLLCTVHGPYASQKSALAGLQFECEVKFAQFVDCPSYCTNFQAFSFGTSSTMTIDPWLSREQTSPTFNRAATATSAHSKSSIERIISDALRESIIGMIRAEKFPKMVLTLNVTILQSSGNIGHDLAAAINASTLALADSAVEMFDMVVASTVVLKTQPATKGSSKKSEIEQPPSSDHDPAAEGCLTVASRCNAPEITQMWCEGRARIDAFFSMMEKAVNLNTEKTKIFEEILRCKIQNMMSVK